MHLASRNRTGAEGLLYKAAPPFGLYPCRIVRIVVKDPEEFEQALREFRRKVQEQGLVREMRRRSHYVPPAEARKIKSLRARRRRTR
jgi:small subunit ribosomal protein S21